MKNRMPTGDENLKLSSPEEDILTVLRNQELYGLQIVKAMEEASSGAYSLVVGSLYPILHRLKDKGYLTSRWGEDDETRGGARRRYYLITNKGLKALTYVREKRQRLYDWQPAGSLV